MMNYLSKFSPKTEHLCEPLRKLTSTKGEQTWNNMYQKLYISVKCIIKNVSMAFYNEKKLYLETNASGVSLEVSLL